MKNGFVKKYIVIPTSDKISKYIIGSIGKNFKKTLKKQVLVTKEELVDYLIEWKNDESPGANSRIGASEYYRYLCEKLNLL